jgi:hypothetical protein
VAEVARFTGAELVYSNLDNLTIDRLEEALATDVRFERGGPATP